MTGPWWLRGKYHMLAIVLVLFTLSVVIVTPTVAQGSGGFGVGSGHGQEVGINLPVFQQVISEVNAGQYDRPCTAAEHNPNQWHSLVNVEAKCHFDHHHGDDPNYVNDIFGEPGAWFQSPGNSISYPWQTFPATTRDESNAAYLGTGQMENEAKHEGYYWIVRRDQPCNTSNRQFCVKDFRVQYHGIMHAHGAAVRWHSMSAEVRGCRDVNNPSTCGIIRTGGWMDHGPLLVHDVNEDGARRALCGHALSGSWDQYRISLPVDTQYMPFRDPAPHNAERCHPQLNSQMIAEGPRTGNVGDGPKAEWWVHGASDFRFQLQVSNPIGNIVETSPGSGQLENHIFCSIEDADCEWNQSIMTMRLQYIVPVNSYYVQGHIQGSTTTLGLDDRRFISRFGGIRNNCTAPGLDCIPIEYNNIHLSVNPGEDGLPGFQHTPCTNCQKVDYDISPAGEQWITWFYYKYGHATPHHPEPTPEPEIPEGPAIVFEVAQPDDTHSLVNVRLIGVSGVYGLEAACTVDPQVLQGTALTKGDGFSDANSFYVDSGFQADGRWQVAASLLRPNTPLEGDHLAFTFNYDVLNSGDGQLACEALAVDEDGKALGIEVINGSIIITPPSEPPPVVITEEPPVVLVGAVVGQAAYQNRPDDAGITVKLVGPNETAFMELVTGPDGTYAFPDIAVGEYVVQFHAPQHIPVVGSVVITNADETVEFQGELRAGDVDDNGLIDIQDVTLVGANFGLTVIPEIGNVDLNADGQINISDLALVGGNLDLESPVPSPAADS